MNETGLCPNCNTLWNTHNEDELEECRLVRELQEFLPRVIYLILSPAFAPDYAFLFSMN